MKRCYISYWWGGGGEGTAIIKTCEHCSSDKNSQIKTQRAEKTEARCMSRMGDWDGVLFPTLIPQPLSIPHHVAFTLHFLLSCLKTACTIQQKELLIAFPCRCFLRVSFPRQRGECSESSGTCSPEQSASARGSASKWRGAASADSSVGTLGKSQGINKYRVQCFPSWMESL